MLVGIPGGCGAAAHAELGENVAEVASDSLLAQEQLRRDRPVGVALGDERQDLTLTGAERGRTYILACLVGGLAGGSIALFSASGLVAGAGFFALAICWLVCTVRAYLAVRAGD
jgi:predicted membrane protein DUF2306